MRFFRIHKHRNILRPQFNALFRRLEFVLDMDDVDPEAVYGYASELTDFIHHLAMGQFYAVRILQLLEPPAALEVFVFSDGRQRYSKEQEREQERARLAAYRAQVNRHRAEVERLVLELLDFQVWPVAEPSTLHGK